MEQLDAELREAGFDPEALGQRMAIAAQIAMMEASDER